MTRDEHRDIIAFIDGAVRQDDTSVPEQLDVEADAIIRALFVRNPEAAYRVTRLAMVQRDELTQAKTALADVKSGRGKNWLLRLLTPARQQRSLRRDPELPLFPQNVRSP